MPLYLFYWLMYPAIWLLNASANAILKIAGQGEPGPHHEHHYSRDELKLILHSSRAQDPSDQGMRVLASAVELGDWRWSTGPTPAKTWSTSSTMRRWRTSSR